MMMNYINHRYTIIKWITKNAGLIKLEKIEGAQHDDKDNKMKNVYAFKFTKRTNKTSNIIKISAIEGIEYDENGLDISNEEDDDE